MKILIYGAGVIGSIYAARLHGPEHEISILARGERLADLLQHGLILRHAISGEEMFLRIPVVTKLSPADTYDLVIVAVRLDQLATVIPDLAANRRVPNLLFMVNNAAGYGAWLAAVGADRLMVGFPGVAGARKGPFVEYMQAPLFLQRTTVGEPDGRITTRLGSVAHLFRHADFPVSICRNMDAWQKTHAAIVVPLAAGLCAVDGIGSALTQRTEVVRRMIQALREGFAVLKELEVPITPLHLRLLELFPTSALEDLLLQWGRTPEFDVLVVSHVRAAREEMRCLADQLIALARSTQIETPALDELSKYLTLCPTTVSDNLVSTASR
jgi:2-dehydropantoate 2-reductase